MADKKCEDCSFFNECPCECGWGYCYELGQFIENDSDPDKFDEPCKEYDP